MNHELIWSLEESFWLKGVEAFEAHLTEQCLMAFPKPTGILLKPEALEGLKGVPRWTSISMDNRHLVAIEEHLIVIGYEAKAYRGDQLYEAVCSSSYVFADDQWRLFQHQQTPNQS